MSPAARASDAAKSTPAPKDTGAYFAHFVQDRNGVTVMELTGDYDAKLPDGTANLEPRRVIAREFYKNHPDAYDMLVVFTQFPIDTGDAFAFYHSVRNQVLGLGIDSFDNTPSYGSQGKLLGMIDMADLQRHAPTNLNANFDRTLIAFSHEFLHQFAAYVKYRKPDGSFGTDLIGFQNAHWSYLLDTDASVLFGSKWRDNGDGTFTATDIEEFYSPLDMYLMGFKKKEDVPPFFIIDAPGVDPTQLPALGASVTGTRRMITVDDVIAAEGPRLPDVTQSQKEYRLAFIYVARPGQAVSNAELVALNDVRRAIGTRFSAITGGVANVNVFSEGLSTATTGAPPGLPPPQSPPATAVNLGLATSWLKSMQKADGSWSDTPPTAIRDSAVSATILQTLEPGFAGLQTAAVWLDGRATSSVDFLSRKLGSLAVVNRSPVATHADELLAMQNGDGGWGAAQGYNSNPLDTALALQTLQRRAAPLDAAATNGFAYLRANQNADGGWGNVAGGLSRTTTSAQALAALQADSLAQDAIGKARTFLAGRQNADGGFGDSPSSVHDTANVVAALMGSNATSSIRFNDAVQYLGVNQRADGSWGDSVYATALALDVLARANTMNWAITGFTASPARTTDGQRVTLNVTVANTGNQNAPAGKLRVYEGDPASGAAAVGPDGDLPLLVPGASATVSVQWNTLGKAGSRTLYAVVDPDHAQQELSVSDDVATLPYVVDGAGSGPDFLLTASDVTVTPAHPTQLPAPVTITALLTNAGFGAGTNVKVVLWQGTGANRQRVAETVIPTFNARSTQPVTFQATITSAGTSTFSVEIDPDHAIAESDTTNNAAEVTVSTGADIDLEVRTADITMDKATPRNGEDVTFSVKLRNKGTVATPDFAVRYTITIGGTATQIATNTIHLAAGQEVVQSVPWRASATGAVTFGVELDPAAAVADSDRTNNAAQVTFTVASDSGPSLAVSFRDIVATPNPALEGSPLAISALVRNLGDQAASPVEVAFYNGDPAQGAAQIGALQTIASLAAGDSQAVSVQWTSVPDAVTKVLFVVVDPANKVPADAVRDDNRAFITVPVKSLPDLAVSAGNLVLAPALPKPGDAVTLTARVDNVGQQDAANVLVRVYDGDPAAGGVQVGGDQLLASVAAQASATATFAWSFPAAAGDRILFVQVDPLQAVPEKNRANNTAQLTVGVQSGDATASARYFSPNGDGVLDTVDFTFRLPSARTVSIQVLDSAGAVVRRYSGPDLANITAGRWTWDGKNDTGSVLIDDDYRIQAVDATSGAVVGEAAVTLDNNRSSLIEAIGTPFGLKTNLTCSVPNWSTGSQLIHYTADGTLGYFVLPAGNAQPGDLPSGIYSVNSSGGDLRLVVGDSTSNSIYGPTLVSPDGAHLVFHRYNGTTVSLWTSDGAGGGIHQLETGSYLDLFGFSVDGTEIVARQSGAIVAISLASGSVRSLYTMTGSFRQATLSPDRRKLLVEMSDPLGSALSTQVVDVASAASVNVPSTYDGVLWAPDSRAFAVVDLSQRSTTVYDADGALVHALSLDGAGIPHQVGWGDDSSALFVESGPADSCNSLDDPACQADSVIRRLSVSTGESAEALRLPGHAVWLYEYVASVSQRFMPVAGRAELIVKQTIPNDDGSFNFIEKWLTVSTRAPYASKPLPGTDTALLDAFSNALQNGGGDSQGFGAFGRMYFYAQQWDSSMGGNCMPFHSEDFWTFRTLKNLTADLRVVRSTSLLKLRGTATDAHFAKYSLDYATVAAPDTWLPIAPVATVPVLDGDLAQWAPPAPGAYLVRLAAEDLAGNRRETIKRVSWGANAVITDVYRTPEFISPNGDGVQDKTLVHYRVLEPANLEFRIDDDQGQRVRTFTRSHPAAGVEATLEWDGRDEAGNVVHDGVYKLTVLDYEFSITVDTVAPAAPHANDPIARMDLKLGPVETDEAPPAQPATVNHPHVRLDWLVADANFAKIDVEREDPGQPGVWAPWYESNRQDVRTAYDPLLIPLETAARGRFRVIASDAAGNTTTQVLALAPQAAIANAELPAIGWSAVVNNEVALDDLSAGIRVEVAETVAAPTAQVAIEFQGPVANLAPPGPAWSQRILDLPTQPGPNVLPAQQSTDGAFVAFWDMRELTAAGDYFFRVRITDANGQVTASDPVRVTKPPNFVLTDAKLADATELDAHGFEHTGLLIDRIDLLVQSAQDPAFAAERAVWSRPGASTIAGLGDFLITANDTFRTCVDYSVRLRGIVKDRPDPIYSTSETVRTCIFVQTTVEPVVAACGVQPPGRLQVQLLAQNQLASGVALALLEFGRKRADGSDDIFFSKVNPAIRTPYTYVLDTAALSEGTHGSGSGEFFSRLTDIQNHQVAEGVRIVVDRTPVDARITVPIQGQKICALRQTDINGAPHAYIDLEGSLNDAAGFDYAVEYAPGDAPQAWAPAGTIAPDCPAAYDQAREGGARGASDNAVSWDGSGGCPGIVELAGQQATGRLGRLYDVNGTYTARIRARDWGGFQSCPAVTFFVDGRVETQPASIDRTAFVPGATDDTGRVAIAYHADEPIKVTIRAYRRADVVLDAQGRMTSVNPGAVPVRHLAEGLDLLGGDATAPWDGRDDGGALVADGTYVLAVTYADACTNTAAELPFVVVADRTPPAVAISVPAADAQVSSIVDVKGSVSDASLASYVLEFGEGADPQSWSPIASGTQNVADGDLGSWNTLGLKAGPYTLRLRAGDRVGNTAETRVAVTVSAASASLVAALEAAPPIFSPNNDGQLDQAALRFSLDSASTVTLAIYQDAVKVRTLLDSVAQAAGSSSVLWDGKSDSGTLVPDGVYTVQFDASTAAGATQTVRIPIAVDTAAPSISVTQPSAGFARGVDSVVGSIGDAYLLDYTVTLRSLDGGATVTLDQGTDVRSGADLGDLAGLPEGRYEVDIVAHDRAGNQRTIAVPFQIDNTPPKVTLTAPAAGTVLGMKASPFGITGTIDERNFKLFQLNLAQGPPPAPATLASGTTPPSATIQSLDLGPLVDGTYTLQLMAQDQAGWTTSANVDFVVDKTPPVASIALPAENDYLRIGADIKGTATDANFKQFKLEIAPGPRASASRFTEVLSSAAPVDNALLGRLAALPPDGVQTLRLTVTDKADNVSTALVQVTVDTTPPAVPLGLTAKVQNRQDVVLAWNAVADADAAGYYVYRDGTRITPAAITATTYTDGGVPEGDHLYAVSAVDRAGNESARSPTVTARVSLSTPTAQITAPAHNGTVSGVVDIQGSAYAPQEFKEFRVSVGVGSAPAAFTLLRRSTVPAQGETLAQWNTTGLAEGATYTIQLEAEDTFGAIGRDTAVVTIDNTAPARPVNLHASVATSDVTLTWTPNTEADLDGYLLYRNEQLVNQTGPLVGDIRQFLIRATTYVDKAVHDGTYDYTVVAVDKAGNQSLPSAPAHVTIDVRAPKAVIVKPAAGAQVDRSTHVLAASDDNDIAQVQLQYRAFGATAWINLGAAITQAPYGMDWDLTALAYGDYELRAVATDVGGKTDPAPAVVRITRARLDRPPTPSGLTAHVNGGDVALTWTAVTATDLAGYVVDRIDAAGNTTRVTGAPVAEAAYTDSGVADGDYSYTVSAADSFGNESAPSSQVAARVFSIDVTQPYTPTDARSATLDGAGKAGFVTTLAIHAPGGDSNAQVAADAQGKFSFGPLALDKGDNRYTVVQRDAAGNLSKAATPHVMVGDLPAKVAGLAGTVSGRDAMLAWTENDDADLAGYYVSVEGDAQVESPAIATVVASSQDAGSQAAAAADGDTGTSWYSAPDDALPTLEIDLTERRLVPGVFITWDPYGDPSMAPDTFTVEGWDGEVWVPLAKAAANTQTESDLRFARPYLTDKLRIRITRPGPSAVAEIADVEIDAIMTVPGNSATVTMDGTFHFAVSAFTTLGLVGPASDPITLAVGDTTAPDPVVLQASASGRDVTLTWTASASSDVNVYTVMRDGGVIAVLAGTTLTYVDQGVANGDHAYAVVAQDAAGNNSVPSNTVVVTIAVDATGQPANLVVAPVPIGSALDLSWTAPASGTAPVSYGIERATQPGGPYTQLADQPTGTTYRDTGLTNGTRYFYRVFALNGNGDAGPRSAEASGVPQATIAPASPLLLSPASARHPATVTFAAATVAGFADAGSSVALLDNGRASGNTLAAPADSLLDVSAGNVARLSPDGSWAFAGRNGNAELSGIAAGAGGDSATVVKTFNGIDPLAISWAGGSRRVAYVFQQFDSARGAWINHPAYLDVDELVPHALSALELETGEIAISADGLSAYGVGTRDGHRGLWRIDLAGDSATVVTDLTGTVANLALSPNGDALAYVHNGNLEILDLATRTPRVQTAAQAAQPSWSAAGDAIAYTAPVAGKPQVFVVDFTGAAPRAITTTANAAAVPVFSPDGTRIAYYDNGSVHVRSIASGDETTPMGYTFGLDWVASGYLAGNTYGVLEVLRPAGQFRIPDVLFQPGANSLTATASLGGPSSAPSAAALVTYSTADRPDLAVSVGDIVVLPGVPSLNATARITATVRNLGPRASPGTSFVLQVVDPAGAARTLVDTTIPSLASGGSTSVVADWVPAQAGTHQISAAVDRLNEVPEVSEANNAAVRDVTVVDGSLPRIEVATDAAIYPQNAPVAIEASVVNGGAIFSGTVELRVEDGQGFLVATLPPQAINALDFGQSVVADRSWNTGATLPGRYAIRARLKDASGTAVGEALATFTIDAPLNAAATITTDRAQYAPGDTAHIAAHVTFPSGAGVGQTGDVLIRVLDSAGLVRFESLRTMPLGTTLDVTADWSLASQAPGDYTAVVEVHLDGRTIASASTLFKLVAPTLAPPTVAITAPAQNAVFTAPARIVLAAGASSPNAGGSIAKVEFFQGTTLLGAVTAPPYTFEWSPVPAGRYAVHARATDDRGVATDSAAVSIVVDTLPTVSIDTPAANASFLAPATIAVTASAQDADGTIAKIEVFQGALKLGECAATPCTVTWNGAGAGNYVLTAVATDDLGGRATSAAVAIVVTGALQAPTVTLTSPAEGTIVNALGTFDLAASASSPNVGGSIAKVEFFAGTAKIGESLAAPYAFTWSDVPAGTYALRARATDNAGTTADSAPVNVVVNALPTASVVAPLDGATYTAPATVAVTAEASDADGTIAKVQVFVNGAPIGECAATPCTVTATGVAAGSYTISASAFDDRGAVAASAPVTITVANPLLPPTVALTSPAAGTTVNAPGSFTISADAASPNAGGSVAKVEFFSGTTKIGESLAAPYTFNWTNVPAGGYSLTARATDDRGVSTDSAAVAVIVNALPTVSITAPAANATFTAPADIAITAAASDSDGTIAKIEVFQGAVKLGECAASPCTITFAQAPAASYSLTARATDNRGAAVTSAAVPVTVQPPLAPPTVSITAPAAGTVVNAPGSFAITASAASPNTGGSIAKVEFFAGTAKIGESLAAPFAFNWTNVPAGSYSLTARATDDHGATTDSSAVAVTVNALPSVSITAPASGASFVAPADIAISAAASDSDGTIAKIEVFQGATKLGECLASPCGVTLGQAAAGTYTLTAKATDDRGASATSTAVTVSVGTLAGTLALSPSSATVGQPVQVSAQVTSPAAVASLPLKVRVYNPATNATLTQWTTNAAISANTPFSWAFSWDTTGQPPGSYHAALSESRSGTDAVLADVPITLNAAVTVQLSASLAPNARVLALVTCYQSSGTTDTRDLACAESRKAYLDQLLASLGVPHRVVTDADLFRSEMRCADWNVYWLAGGREKLKDRMADELAEQVYAGKGLIVDGIYTANSASLDAVLGVSYAAQLDIARNYLVSPTDSLLSYGNFSTSGRALRYTALAGATVHARFDSAASDPAVISSPYGNGRAVTVAFDLVKTMQAQPLVQGDLAPLFARAAPAARETGRPIAASLTVTNTGPAATVNVVATLPAGVTLSSATPAPTSGTTWSLPLAVGEARTIGLQLAASAGSYTVGFDAGGATTTLAFAAAPISGGTHADVVAALNALAVTGAEATARDNAVTLVNQSSSALASSPETAVYDLLDAAKEVAKIANPGDADDRLARLDVATGPAICQQVAACLRPGQGAPTLTGYSMLVFGNASLSSGSVEGSVGVSGSATLSSQSIASQWAGDAARLIAGGNVTWSTGSVGINGTGVIRAGGVLTLSAGVGRRSATGGTATEDWTALKSYYASLATSLSQASGTAAIAGAGGQFTLRGTDPVRNVFTLTSAQAASTRSLVFDVPLTSTVIVNVPGSSVSFSSGQQFLVVNGAQQPMAQDPFATHVLFNFPQATSLAASSWSFQGSVLAPQASFSFSNGSMFGQVFVGTLSSSSVGFQQCGTFMGTLP